MRHLIHFTGIFLIIGIFLIGCDAVVDSTDSNIPEFSDQSVGVLFSLDPSGLLIPFTQDELDDNWVADRKFPTGGVESVSFNGRDNVAKIGVIAAQQDADQFRRFEGIKKVDDFGTKVQVDLYVPGEWQDANVVNVGFWSSDNPISAYPLIVYRNGATVDAGFYTWDGVGYVYAGIAVEYEDWNTLAISLDTENEFANYIINGEAAGGMTATGSNIGQVFLNHYNDGERDYFAYWHAGIPSPKTIDDCKKGGWQNYGFRNQGQCIAFVNTGRDSR